MTTIVEWGDRRKRSRRLARVGALVSTLVGLGGILMITVATTGGGTPSVSQRVTDTTNARRHDATPEPSSQSKDDARTSPAALSDALEAQFPGTFGGLVTTGEQAVEIFVVGDPNDVAAAARRLAGDRYAMTFKPADRAMSQARALRSKIDAERGQLAALGVHIGETGIRVASDGPRVLLLLAPESERYEATLRERYGDDTLEILVSSGVVPQ